MTAICCVFIDDHKNGDIWFLIHKLLVEWCKTRTSYWAVSVYKTERVSSMLGQLIEWGQTQSLVLAELLHWQQGEMLLWGSMARVIASWHGVSACSELGVRPWWIRAYVPLKKHNFLPNKRPQSGIPLPPSLQWAPQLRARDQLDVASYSVGFHRLIDI